MTDKPITATPYVWRDPEEIPSRTETISRLNKDNQRLLAEIERLITENAYLREALKAARAALGDER